MTKPNHYQGLIEKYRSRLPVTDSMRVISLCEGNTPLIRLENLTRELAPGIDVLVKFDGLNPTGSFKDRGMTMAVTRAVDDGARAVICASTGNTSAAAAAYASRAGIAAFVLIPEGKIAAGKLAQAIVHGARVIQIRGNFDEGMEIVKQIGDETAIALVNSVNPYRLQGQKTAAFEICDSLGRAPDYHYLPVGNAGNISAYWMGYNEYFVDGLIAEKPVMVGCQASGAAPFINGEPIDDPETIATAIRIGRPQSWDKALAAQRESEGWFNSISDEEILATQRRLSSGEGVFCEPASATSVAGALRDIEQGRIAGGSTVVCTLTGSGLKDTDTALGSFSRQPVSIDADYRQIKQLITSQL